MSKVPLTKRGAEKLREELQRLKTIERPQVISAISEARVPVSAVLPPRVASGLETCQMRSNETCAQPAASGQSSSSS